MVRRSELDGFKGAMTRLRAACGALYQAVSRIRLIPGAIQTGIRSSDKNPRHLNLSTAVHCCTS
jgi:hypothetical protein